MDHEELSDWLRLLLTPGVGTGTARRLLARFGPPAALWRQTEAALCELVTPTQARALCRVPADLPAQLDLTLQWLALSAAGGPARAVITLGDAAYPSALLETEDPPLLLYVMGEPCWVPGTAEFAALAADRTARLQGAGKKSLEADSSEVSTFAAPMPHCLAVVGSRNPTAQGADNARQFAKALRAAGFTIVSGLALGVDAAAHEGALEQEGDGSAVDGRVGPATIAVVGTGLDRVYPSRHLDLARRIAAHGLLISEYPLGTPPLAGNFPKRNRIIAGLSQGTLVVEAALQSGSLITARLASEQGRDVFAIPGSIHAPQSRGGHTLIRQGAKLVESAQDILEELPAWSGFSQNLPAAPVQPVQAMQKQEQSGILEKTSKTPPLQTGKASSPPESALLSALGYDPIGLDMLQARTGMATAALQVQLLELELAGLVARLPGGWFQRRGQA